jgi:hypothetical protein
MTLRRQTRKPLALIPVGMMFLVLAQVLPRAMHPPPSLGRGLIDGLRGLMFGAAIGFNLLAVILLARRRRARGN